MKNIYIKSIIFTFFAASLGANFSYAQVTSTTPAKEKDVSQIEISLPINKDDFLLFYGITKDEDTNQKLDDLRKEFISKYKELKSEYKESFNEIVKDKDLSPISFAEEVQDKSVKDIKKDSIKNIKTQPTTPIAKKYIINEKQKGEEAIVPASINIINEKTERHVENSSWFQKVKSFFNW